jgi:hypothetical protein
MASLSVGLALGAWLAAFLSRTKGKWVGRICTLTNATLFLIVLAVGSKQNAGSYFSHGWLLAGWFALTVLLGSAGAWIGESTTDDRSDDFIETLERIHPAHWLWLWLFLQLPALYVPRYLYVLWVDAMVLWPAIFGVFHNWRWPLISVFNWGMLGLLCYGMIGGSIKAVAKPSPGEKNSIISRVFIFVTWWIPCACSFWLLDKGILQLVNLGIEIHGGRLPWWALPMTGDLFSHF